MRLAALTLVAVLAVPAVSSASRQGPRGDALGTVAPGVVDGATGKQLADAGAVVLDVRTPEEFAQGHVPGAKNIPYDQVAKRAAEIGPPSTPVVVYCKSGRRSALAIEDLSKLGYSKLWNAGGYADWPKGGQ
jgi:rhodanese-related sulfurtransferase